MCVGAVCSGGGFSGLERRIGKAYTQGMQKTETEIVDA